MRRRRPAVERDPGRAAGFVLGAERPWASAPGDVLHALRTVEDGLSADEAARRLRTHGPNALRRVRPPSLWTLLADQFRSTVVVLLVAAAVIAAVMGEIPDAIAIAAVLLVNAALGFATEWRARSAMESLRRMDVRRASVVRDGRVRDVDAREVVPGDVLSLEPGASVSADARLLSGAEVQVVEAPLTGESVPVAKSARSVERDTGLADRTSMLHKGTVVASGSARAVVVATGVDTEIGRIGALVAATEDETPPLQRRMEQLGRRLIWVVLAVALVVAAVGLLRGVEPALMLQTSIALAIAAVPEGLPAVVTITLAVGMSRMARRRALVRRLSAVETLGSTTVVCTDKTGTLTSGEMTLRRIWTARGDVAATGTGYGPDGEIAAEGDERAAAVLVLRAGVLASHADVFLESGTWKASGDPTEAALVVAGLKAGLRRDELVAETPRIGEVPFSSARMLMASFHEADGSRVAWIKGAPERVLEVCTSWLRAEGRSGLDDASRREILDANERLAGDGLRVLALARRDLDGCEGLDADALRDATFLGLVGLQDPAADGVVETVGVLLRAGVRTLMLTGDQRRTGEAIAREVGVLTDDQRICLDGVELAALDDDALRERVARIGVVSRVDPAQKLRVVDALRARGEIVAMLGDGVNDAPALKRAHIGVAMGRRGTDVAREAAHLVLQDDRLVTVAAAVEEGRVLFDDIRKFVWYLFSCNLSEVMVLLLAAVAGLPLPLLPLQILWLNLVTDVFPALALAMEPGEPDVMERPPRDPHAAILSRRFLLSVLLHGALLTACVLGAFVWALGRDGGARATTVVFMSIALAQLLHVMNARSDRPVLFSRRLVSNPWIGAAAAVVIALQAAALYAPGLADLLGNVPLGPAEWSVVLVAGVLPLAVGQLWRGLAAGRRAS